MAILPVSGMIDKPNLLATTTQGLQQGFALGRARAEEKRRNQLAEISGQAYTAAPDQRNQLVGQAVGVDPQAGMALGEALSARDEGQRKQEDAQARRLRGAAKYMMQAIESGNQAQIEGAHRTVANFMGSFGQPFPETYTPDMLPKIQEVLARTAYLDEGGEAANVQSRFIDNEGNMVALFRDGTTRIVGKADPSMQILEGEGGFYGVNRRNLQASPVQLGGGQAVPQAPDQMQAPSQAVESSGREVTLDPSLPPHVRAQIAANPDAFAALPEQADVTLPPVERQGFPSQPTGQLRPAAKTKDAFVQLSSDETAALGLPPGTVAQRNVSTGKVDIVSRPPAVAGGAKAGKAAADARAKLPQLQNVVRGVDRIEQALAGLSGGVLGGVADTGPLDQFAVRYTKEGRELEAAVGGIQNSMLALTRVPGVGAQSDLEARIANLQYPSLENPPEVNARTLENLRAFVADLQAAYDNVIQGGQGDAPAAQQQAAPRRLRFNPATGRLE